MTSPQGRNVPPQVRREPQPLAVIVGVLLILVSVAAFLALDTLRDWEQELFYPAVEVLTGRDNRDTGWNGGLSALVPLLLAAGVVAMARPRIATRALLAVAVGTVVSVVIDFVATMILVLGSGRGGVYVVAGTLSGLIACLVVLLLGAAIASGRHRRSQRLTLIAKGDSR